MPEVDDRRIKFVKGWFQDTWQSLPPKAKTLFVHFDADLYSSTLFALCQIDKMKQPYLAVFDDFASHEARALYDYRQAFNAAVEPICQFKVPSQIGPWHLLCKITPHGTA